MSISVDCPDCRSSQTFSESLAGRRIECPLCGTPLDIPEIEHNPYAAPSTSLETEGVSVVVPGSLFGKLGLANELFASNLPLISLIVLTTEYSTANRTVWGPDRITGYETHRNRPRTRTPPT